MNKVMIEALQARRETVERIIRKFETLDRPEQRYTSVDGTQVETLKEVVSNIRTVADIVIWARRNFEPSDVLLLETKFQNKLDLHPERVDDPNFCRLIALVFYLMDLNQWASFYREFSHRAISAAFTTHLDMYHPLHLLESACFLSEMAVQSYVQKARIGEALDMLQDFPLTPQQELVLAKLCLLPEQSQRLAPLYFANNLDNKPALVALNHQGQASGNLLLLLDVVNNPEKDRSTLTQRLNLTVEEAISVDGQRKKINAPYYPPNLDLCLRLQSVLVLTDIKKSAAAALLDKLTALWEILLPLNIDLGAMKDFQ